MLQKRRASRSANTRQLRPSPHVEFLEDRCLLSPAVSSDPMLPDLMPVASYLNDWQLDKVEIPGRTLLRLTNAVENVGSGPMELRGGTTNPDGSQEVFQRIYQSNGAFTERLAGTFTFHPEHEHIHFDDFAEYNLRAVTADSGVGDVVASGGKISFCLLDVDRLGRALPGSPKRAHYRTCHQSQGISIGWADVYDKRLPDQWIDMTGVSEGTYWLESIVDPTNRIEESNELNNVARIQITIGPPPLDDFPDTFESATAIPLSPKGKVEQRGTIGDAGDVDMFQIVAPRKGRLTILQSAPVGSGLNSFLYVYDTAQNEIARNDDGAGKLNSRVRIKVLLGQTLFVKAAAHGSDTGQYVLSIHFARGR